MPAGHERQTYRPQRLPQAAERTLGEGSLRAALDVARRVHETDTPISPTEPETKEERWRINQLIRPLEKDSLYNWALTNGVLLNESSFTKKWIEFGLIEGGEHQLYQEDGCFFKRNNLYYHSTWLEYFHRLVLHNWLFPETAVRFEGLMMVDEDLQPVISQQAFLAIRGAKREEVEAEMKKRDFQRSHADNYYSPTLGIRVDDLHDENVLVSPAGSLLIFDPVIYLATPAPIRD